MKLFTCVVLVSGLALVGAACSSTNSGGSGTGGSGASATGGGGTGGFSGTGATGGTGAGGTGGAAGSATGGAAGSATGGAAGSATGGAAGSATGGAAGAPPCVGTQQPGEPYARSCVITKMSVDWKTHDRLGNGADNWPVTWAQNGHQYTAWGDGWGFQSQGKPKISLGVSRIEGSSAKGFNGFDVWLGDGQGSGKPNDGKSYGILAIGADLYMWVSPGSGPAGYADQRLWKSVDGGKSWSKASWSFAKSDGLINPTFLQRGKGYAGAPDNYVYVYANHVKDSSALTIQKPGEIALLRVDKSKLMTRTAYQFYAGPTGGGSAAWTSKIGGRKPVFLDPKGVGWNTSASFNAPLGRYLLMTEHSQSFGGNLGVFDAPTPWGPWTTVSYQSGFGSPPTVPQNAFFWSFSNKWLSANGKSFVLVFTGIGNNDSWNTVHGTFTAQ